MSLSTRLPLTGSLLVAAFALSACTVKNEVPRVDPGVPVEGNMLPIGVKCETAANCASGHCANNVCCGSPCGGVCESCALTGSVGTCTPVPEGLASPNPAHCPRDAVGSCGLDGTCDGTAKCRRYPDNTVCAAGTCEGAQTTGTKQCRGGSCQSLPNQICAPFTCDKATSVCFAECTSDLQCAPGRSCVEGSCGKKPSGVACKVNADCESGSCSDGVCCNTVCAGPCVTCNDVSSPGKCVPAKKGVDDPHGICVASEASTCGFSGKCNGLGSCARFATGTPCAARACAGGSVMPSATCNDQGSCVLGAAITCAPFMCSGGDCKTACATNADCVAPAVCTDGSCGKRGLGQTCSSAAQCGSGFCSDGVCCDGACEGKCRACALSGSPGRCVNVPANTLDPRAVAGERDPAKACIDTGAPSCKTNGMCDGSGGCLTYTPGTVCSAGSCDAATNRASPSSTCDGSGACVASSPLQCAPFRCSGNRCAEICASDADCTAPNVCRAGSCGKKGNGQVCSMAAECQSGTCAQGVCCSTECNKGCFSCALPGKEGSCAAVPAGALDPLSVCKDNGAQSCGTDGTCNGAGNCRLYTDATICKQANCSSGQGQAASYCSGTGVCIPGTSRQCEPYLCNVSGTACIDSCSMTAECSVGNSCNGGRCGLKGLGASCTAAADCATAFCADGVCCNEACVGTCRACNGSGSVGTCANVPAGTRDLAGDCAATTTSTCGTSGQCDGQGGCSKWGASTACTMAMCSSGTSTLLNAGLCNGQGMCVPGSEQSCGEFLCGSSACKNTCTPATVTTDCIAGSKCSLINQTYSCGLKPKGAGCADASECAAGLFCTDGTCCATAMCGSCQSCKNAAGACQNVADGSQDVDSCTADGMVCGLIGRCDGAGACKKANKGTICAATTCAADGNGEIRQECDGTGGCATVAKPCANNLKCVAGACKTRCDTTADCQNGMRCPGQSGVCKP